jgi:hypothetical protein
MRQAIHTKNIFDVDAIIRFKEVTEVIFLNDFIGDVSDAHANVFRTFERGIEIKVGNVHGHEASIRSENDTIEQDFGNEHVGSGSGDVAGIVDAIAIHH